MKLRFNILSPVNSGAPFYNLCGGGVAPINNSNLNVTLELNGVVFINTTDLSSLILPSTPITCGSRIITNISYNAINGFEIDVQNPVIDSDFLSTLKVDISKVGFQSYSNKFNLYDYDLGNATLGTPQNPEFDFYLINNTNNINLQGLQTKAFSKFLCIIHKPFTEKIEIYNLLGTQGHFLYTEIDSSSVPIRQLSNSRNFNICSKKGFNFTQTVTLLDNCGNILDTCQSVHIVDYKNWTPIIETTISCEPSCSTDCVSSLATGDYTINIDVNNLAKLWVDDVEVYPYHNSTASLFIKLYDYTGLEIFSQVILNSVLQLLNPSTFVNSIFTYPLPPLPNLGDVILTTLFLDNQGNGVGGYDEEVYKVKCKNTNILKRCNWYSIEETNNCGEYIVKNCSVEDSILTIKQLQDDKTFLTISTTIITALSSTTINLQKDGVYSFEVPSKDDVNIPEILIVINDCSLKNCLFTFLSSLICSKEPSNCRKNIEEYYNFNSLILNLHTYYALINEELNFNYIYNTLGVDKINNLHTINTYLTNLSSYCEKNCVNPCKCD